MTSKEIFKMAVEMKNPPGVPIIFFNRNKEKSDAVIMQYDAADSFAPDVTGRSEWGFIWHTVDDTMGQPTHSPLIDSIKLPGNYTAPDPNAPGRFNNMKKAISENRDKYFIADLGISGFNLVTFIRGFDNVLTDLYEDPDGISELIDIVFDYETQIIKNYCELEIDAVAFYDDWGTQASLMISPIMWRQIFKERYRKQFDLIHSYGKHVFFHSCGQVMDIIPDFIEIGADILNLNQPSIFGIQNLGEKFAGKVCFNCPVDHQTVAINGTKEEIYQYVHDLNKYLNTKNGGFVANIEDYQSCGMSNENYHNIVSAFMSLNEK